MSFSGTMQVRGRNWTTAAVFAGFFALYLATPTSNYTFDAVSYAGMVRLAEQAGPPPLFHPHHLLTGVAGWTFWRLLRLVSPQIDPLGSLQVMNAFAGAVGLAVLFTVLRRLLIDTDREDSSAGRESAVAAVAAAAVGLTFGWWVASTDGRANIPPMAAIFAAFYFAYRTARTASARSAAALGGSIALAVLLHQSHALFLAVCAAAVLMAPVRTGRKLRLAGAALAAFVPTVFLPYAIALRIHGVENLGEALDWTLTYAHTGIWWSFDVTSNLGRDLYALRHAFLANVPKGAAAIPSAAAASSYGLIIFSSILVSLGLLDRTIGTLRRRKRRQAQALSMASVKGGSVGEAVRQPGPLFVFNVLAGIWILVYSAFFTVWNPGYFVFWIPVMSAWVMVLAVNASAWTDRRYVVWTAAAAAVCFAIANAALYVLPRMPAESNQSLAIARQVRANTPARSLVVVAGTGYLAQMEVYLPYFSERETVSLHEVMSRHGKNGLRWLARKLRADLSAGKHVYLFGEAFDSPKAWQELSARYGLERQAVHGVLDSFRPKPVFRAGDQLVYELRAAGGE